MEKGERRKEKRERKRKNESNTFCKLQMGMTNS